MKVEKIEVFPVTIPFKQAAPLTEGAGTALGSWSVCRFVVVKMYTNEDIIGIGEAPPWVNVSREGQGAIVSTIRDYLAPIIIGKDPFNIEEIWKEMDRVAPGNPQAKTAVDVGLYDIMGKALNIPMYKLIGGLMRDKIPLTGIVGLDSITKMVKTAEKWTSEGYETIRLKIGMGLNKDEELLKTARESLGDKIKIRVDANQIYRPHEAVKIIKTLENYNIEIVEQPVAWYDLKGLSFVNKLVNTPLMPHESLYDIYDVVHLIDADAVSVFGFKMDRPGGITNAVKARTLAELNDIPATVISSIELGINTAASMQFAATIKRMDFACEASGPIVIADNIVKNPIEIKDGFAKVPKGIGIGVEIDEDKLKKYSEGLIICENTEIKS